MRPQNVELWCHRLRKINSQNRKMVALLDPQGNRLLSSPKSQKKIYISLRIFDFSLSNYCANIKPIKKNIIKARKKRRRIMIVWKIIKMEKWWRKIASFWANNDGQIVQTSDQFTLYDNNFSIVSITITVLNSNYFFRCQMWKLRHWV